MLNSEKSENYIESLMNLSEEAQETMQKIIMRSKTNLNDLLSSKFSEVDYQSE